MGLIAVSVNDELLQEATKVLGEESATAVVEKALSEFVRIARLERDVQAKDTVSTSRPSDVLTDVEKQDRFRRLLVEFEREAAKGGVFDPSYLAEMSAKSMFNHPDDESIVSD
jgi:hypothetical protein